MNQPRNSYVLEKSSDVIWNRLKLTKSPWSHWREQHLCIMCNSVSMCAYWILNQKGDPAGVLWFIHSPASWSSTDPQGDVLCCPGHRSPQRVRELHPPEQVNWGKSHRQLCIIHWRKSTPQSTGAMDSVCVCVFMRSVGEIPACAEFDCSLLEDAEHLKAKEIELNDLTLETVQHKWEQTMQFQSDD